MKISSEQLKALAKTVNSPERVQRRSTYWLMYKIFNGGLAEVLEDTIRKEFTDPQAVTDLLGRLVPINIMKKVIKKKASVYTEAPLRSATIENTDDDELVEDYEDATKLNIKQKQANRYLELFQKNLKEIFASKMNGTVLVKNLPPHTYEVFNIINPDRSRPDIVCKIVSDSRVQKDQVLYWYSDESFYVTNGDGEVIADRMAAFKNPMGINPSGQLPFVYKCKSEDSVDPIVNDALLKITIAIPIVLTDLFFACKYQCWSMIYTIGVKGEINRNPSTVIPLDFSDNAQNGGQTPVIGSIQPSVDADKVISMVNSVLNLFLSSEGLSGGTLSTGQSSNATDVVSGVSKMMDSAEVMEDRKDQQDDMLDDENMTWMKFKAMAPYWRNNQLLPPQLDKEFSPDFIISTSFKEPKPLLSETDALALSDKRMKLKYTTWTRELKLLYPDYTDDQIEELKQEILDEMDEYPQIYNPMGLVKLGPDGKPLSPDDKLNNKDKQGDNKDGKKDV